MSTDLTAILISIVFPWLVSFLFVLIIIIGIIKIPRMFIQFIRFPTFVKLFFIIILLLAAYLRFQFVPNIHRINFDEDRYLSYAVTFAKFGVQTNINLATNEKLLSGVPDSAARITVPAINGWMLKFFGNSEEVLFQGAKIFSLIQIVLVFILALLITRSYFISLFTMAGMAFLPTPVFWSVSTSLDLYFVTFAILSLISALLYAKKITIVNYLFFTASIILLLFVRIEGFLMLPVLGLFVFFYRKSEKKKYITKNDSVFLIAIVIIIAVRVFLSLSVFGKPWCCGEGTPLETFMPGYFIRNLIPNLQSLLFSPEIPFILTIAAVVAIIKNNKWYTKILALWFIIFFLLYSSYYAGKFFAGDFSGSYGRFFLMLMPPFLILAGVFFEETISYLNSLKKRKVLFSLITILLIGLTLIPTVKNYKFMIANSPFEKIVEADTRTFHKHLEEVFLAKTESNAIVIHTLTAYPLLKGRTIVYIGSFVHDSKIADFVIDQLKKKKSIYVIPSNLCDSNPTTCLKQLKQIEQINIFPETYEKYQIPIAKLKLKEVQEP